MINLKFYRQITPVHCGPAVIQMLLDHIGIQSDQKRITELACAEERIFKYGTRLDQFAMAIREINPELKILYKEHSTLEDIKKILNLGYPVGVEWQGIFEENESSLDDDEGHYSIISEADKNNYLTIIDPFREEGRHFYKIKYEKFLERWWDFNEVIDKETNKPKDLKDEQLLFVIPQLKDSNIRHTIKLKTCCE